ncbi:MAG: HAMP domain-containing protein [Planctomycetes bacterium]|nr:HAMP domain-containing protein [Planctomycetota bacterium]
MPFLQWPRKTLFRRVAALAGCLVFAATFVPSAMTIRSHRAFLEQKLVDHGVAMTRSLSLTTAIHLSRGDTGALRDLVTRLVRDDPQLGRVQITTSAGEVLADSHHEFEGTLVPDLLQPPPSTRIQKVQDSTGSSSIVVTEPVCWAEHPRGAFRAEFPLKTLERELQSTVRRVLLSGVAILACGTLAAAWVARAIARPVSTLAHLASELSVGNFDLPPMPFSPDEIGTLCVSFRDMAARLSEAHRKLRAYSESLERMVAQRTEQLEVKTVQLTIAKEEAERANKTKSAFFANVSHELRTPLHVILNYSEFGLKKIEKADKAKLLHFFSEIRESAGTLLALVNDLLDLSKLEAGKMTYKVQSADLRTLALSVAAEFEPALKEKEIALEVDAPGFSTGATLDVFRISQVLRNLLSNAVKFTKSRGAIRVDFEETSIPAGAAQVPSIAVSVADQGIGIPESELETIFDKFIQSSRTATFSGGTGLGLSICREIVAGHGGWIRAANAQGGGAVLAFCIPREPPPPNTQVARADGPNDPPSKPRDRAHPCRR